MGIISGLGIHESTLFLTGGFGFGPSPAIEPRRVHFGAMDRLTGEIAPFIFQISGTPISKAQTALVAEDRVFVGGSFYSVNEFPRTHLFCFGFDGHLKDWNAEIRDSAPRPGPDSGTVLAVVHHENWIYVAGDGISDMGGLQTGSFAKLHTRTAVADPSFKPRTPVRVWALAIWGTNLLVGGWVYSADGSRAGVAALTSGTGEALPLSPKFGPGFVNCLGTYGDTLLIGGSFSHAENQSRTNLCAIDLLSTNLTSLAPHPDGMVRCLVLYENQLILGGDFKVVGGKDRPHLASIDLATQTVTDWRPAPPSPIHSLAAHEELVYAGGESFFGVYAPENWIRLANPKWEGGELTAVVAAAAGSYTIEKSSDLKTWGLVIGAVVGDEPQRIILTGGEPAAFYRARRD